MENGSGRSEISILTLGQTTCMIVNDLQRSRGIETPAPLIEKRREAERREDRGQM